MFLHRGEEGREEGRREGGRGEGREGSERGPPTPFGSSCIRVNGTNYKSRAISPHYSAGTRREKREGERESDPTTLSGRRRKEEKKQRE